MKDSVAKTPAPAAAKANDARAGQPQAPVQVSTQPCTIRGCVLDRLVARGTPVATTGEVEPGRSGLEAGSRASPGGGRVQAGARVQNLLDRLGGEGAQREPMFVGQASDVSEQPSVRQGSALDRSVARGSLEEAWAAATTGEAKALPGRSRLEAGFGASLGAVRVHTGARVENLLDRLGAAGAARGDQILVADASDGDTLAHEVAHTLQARAGGGEGGGLLAATHVAEAEAEGVVVRIRSGKKARVRRRIGRRDIALRRLRDPVRGAPPLREEDQADPVLVRPQPEARREGARAVAGEGSATSAAGGQGGADGGGAGQREGQAEQDAEQETEATTAEQEQVEGTAQGEQQAADAAEPAAGEVMLEPSPDRREAVDDLLQSQQDNWDEGVETADGHEVEACPRHRIGEGERPFARGPPLEVPATQELPTLDNPEPAEPDRSELSAAQRAVDTQLDMLPQRASFTGGTIDAEREQERQSETARVRRSVDASLARKSVTRPDNPQIELEGEANIVLRKQGATTKVQTATLREGNLARTRTEEDFGDDRMAPVADPTQGHDNNLDGLEAPTVDLENAVEAATRDRIGTAGNVGQLSIEEVVVVREPSIDRISTLGEDRALRRREIDRGIQRSERSFTDLCATGARERERAKGETAREVTRRRGEWRVAADAHVTVKQTEATTLIRDKTQHAEGIAAQADLDAQAELDTAHTQATADSQDLAGRAQAKSEQSGSSSWWQQGIDWLRERIAVLVSWIDDFIDDGHVVIDAMLDRASEVAHGVVELGRSAVQATLDLAHQGVDVIADNLPGELGELAREHRDDMHTYLDTQQAAVDTWADELNADIDTGIEDVRRDLHDGLEDFREGVHDLADAANEVLDVAEEGFMALLRASFPQVAAFVDQGILGPINQAGAQLQQWAQSALDSSGLGSIQSTIEGLHSSRFCQEQTQEEQAADCDAFKITLLELKETFDAMLASPVAQAIQGVLQDTQDDANAEQVDAVSGFFSFIQMVARPLYEWWQSIEPQVSAALEFLGDMAQLAWEFIAEQLGLDISLPPMEAIRQALEKAWEVVSTAVQPLIDQLSQAYTWLVEDSPLAPIIAFFAAIPGAVAAIGQLIGEMAGSAGDWLASAAQTLKDVIMPVVTRVLGVVSVAINMVVDRVVGWADRLLGAFDALLQWQGLHLLLLPIVAILAAWAIPIRLALQLFRDCGEVALRGLADVLANITEYAGTILDIVVGIVQAILGFPVLTVAFFLGNAWRFLVPECYKAPILNWVQIGSYWPECAQKRRFRLF